MWLETTATISTGSAPIRERNSRSFRQCPNFDTMSTTRVRRSARSICSMPKASPTAVKLARSFSTSTGASAEKWTRMKKSPVSRSPNCRLSSMLHPVMKR